MSFHHAHLTTDDHQNAPVTEWEYQDHEDVVRYTVEKEENHLVDFILSEHIGIAHSIHHFGRREYHS